MKGIFFFLFLEERSCNSLEFVSFVFSVLAAAATARSADRSWLMADSSARDVQGWIFDIQRFSIHDGPGIRTTVFLKGCPLRCLWCHNPEGIAREPALSFDPAKCIGCGYCLRACPNQAHRMEGDRHVLDREKCVVCGSCAEECYAGALEIVGREVPVAEALELVATITAT